MRINKKKIEDTVVNVEENKVEDIVQEGEKPEKDPMIEDNKTVEAEPNDDTNKILEPVKIEEDVDDTPIAIIGTTITEKKLNELKSQYGKRGIFKTRFVNDMFIWHKLNRSTFSKIISMTKDIEDREEKNIKCEQEFVRAAVIWPEITQDFLENEDVTVAGLSEEILYNSGFVPPQTERL